MEYKHIQSRLFPASSAVGSAGPFLVAVYTRKNVLFAHSTSLLPRVLASQDTVNIKLGERMLH